MLACARPEGLGEPDVPPAARRAPGLGPGCWIWLWLALAVTPARASAGPEAVAGAGAEAPVARIEVQRERPRRATVPVVGASEVPAASEEARSPRKSSKKGRAPKTDPRVSERRERLEAARADRDTVKAAEDQRSGQHLLESIAELSRLEERLDAVERALLRQQERLRTMEYDFTGRPNTVLQIVLGGYPRNAELTELALDTEDGDTLRVRLSAEQRESLKRGGVLEVARRFVEPREQAFRLTLTGDPWPSGDSGWITLAPPRDRLTLLKLDLSLVEATRGAAAVEASVWLPASAPSEPALPSDDG